MTKRDDELNRFVREALAKGSPRAEIQIALLQAGWREAQAVSALDAYSTVSFAIPVPTPRQYISAREAYLYLVLFATLYFSAYSLGSLIFSLIEQALPDPLHPEWRVERSIRWAISFLVVAAPIFLFTAYQVRRMLIADPTKVGSPTRKWLTYIALFGAAAFLVGDVATLVFWLLGGELTTRFFLKVATVAVIAGAIFGYYLLELKRDEHS